MGMGHAPIPIRQHVSLLMPKEGRAGDRTEGGRFDP
jgi:hypothetical protein